MKKIINGKIYNTNTAKQIAFWNNGTSSSDFHHCNETLYLTKKEIWFLFGKGGPRSKYALQNGWGTESGEGFEVFSWEQALEWLVDKNAINAIEKYFKDLEEA